MIFVLTDNSSLIKKLKLLLTEWNGNEMKTLFNDDANRMLV